LSGRGLCDELITRPEESYRLCCVVVCDLETSRMGAPYAYDISHLRFNTVRSVIFVSGQTDHFQGLQRRDTYRLMLISCHQVPANKTWVRQFTRKLLVHIIDKLRAYTGCNSSSRDAGFYTFTFLCFWYPCSKMYLSFSFPKNISIL